MPPRYVLLTRRRIAGILFYTSFVVFFGWLFFGSFFKVQMFDCQKADLSCDQLIQAELDRFKGKSILTMRWKPVEDKLILADPNILKVKFIPHLPNKMEVQIEVREAQVRIGTSSSSNMLLADKEGFIFSLAKEEDSFLPEIIAQEGKDLEIGQVVDNLRIRSAVKLAILLKENFISFQRIIVNKEGIVVIVSDGIPVLFSDQGDIAKEVTTLQRILSQATIEQKPIKIDVRYAKPVVSY